MVVTIDRFIDRAAAPYIVYDLEYTAWPGSQEHRWSRPGEYREIVQIGAVALDPARSCQEIRSFSVLISPVLNPVLSDYFTGLTGITQAQIRAMGRPYAQALQEFAAFCGQGQPQLAAFGRDGAILEENCRLIGASLPFAASQLVNLRGALLTALGMQDAAIMSSELPGLIGIPPIGPAHDGLADARAIAATLRHLQALPVQFE